MAAAGALFLVSACGAQAQSAETNIAGARQEKISELDALIEESTVSEQRASELAAEIAALKKDETTVAAALIQSAKTERKLSQDIAPIEERLGGYRGQEEAIRASLSARREVLAEVLAALQRMGLNPPPAILVTPQDALASVRSAILLGAVVPELRAETEILLADMDSLKKVTISIRAERERLLVALRAQSEEKIRLDQLVEERKLLRSQSEDALKIEKARMNELAQKSRSLKELLAGIDREIALAEKRAADAKREDEKLAAAGSKPRDPAPPPETVRIAPSGSFLAAKGTLAFPVAGSIKGSFGTPDDSGAVTQGITLAAKPGGRVIAPVEARVLFADTFRSYGNLLILDAGEGYHLVLAGMERLDVAQNQSVLAGEPVGVMGGRRKSENAANAMADSGPPLYIELRKDGKTIDSGPWWAGGPAGRTNNDT
jgi:murein hydrolase activator